MVSFGQPTHVFDFDKIGEPHHDFKGEQKGESIVTLDGKKSNFPEVT